jgi:streptogramin lyase
VWFTADTSVGRIDASGQVTMRPVPGAVGLFDLTFDRNGTLWVADGQADTVWRLEPARLPTNGAT